MQKFDHDSIEAQGFNGRKEALANVLRWDKNYFPTVFYRTNDLVHTLQVLWMVEEVSLFLKGLTDFNIDLARTYALVHDDSEIVNGDILMTVKSRMTPYEREQYEVQEMRAIEQLSFKWPGEVNGFNYKNLLQLALRKSCAEAQLVSYLDKQTSLDESWHEIFAGNRNFYNVSPERKPPARGSEILRLRKKYTLISKILEQKHPFLAEFQAPNPEEALNAGKPHTRESILRSRGFAPYDCWREMILRRGGEEGLRWLSEQKEFAV